MQTQVAIVEDDPLVRGYLADVIAADGGYALVGTAASLAAARGLLDRGVDVYLLDLGLPDGNGASFIPQVRAAGEAKVIVLTSFGDRDTVVRTIEAGADGYLLKDSATPDILAAIEAALAGGAPISAAAAVHLLERLRSFPAPTPGEDAATPLSPRETELLQLFAKGYSYKEAARILAISPLTVGNHVRSIYRKLDVHTRSEAVYEALRSGKLNLG
ncbi:MAG TPA: response regulator transcription factor [Novosphingobium sp.]|nr:response regulator transcription factor [Novosphingobium sp.]